MRTQQKPYTWKDIKNFLIKELKKTKHIMTFGTIGSLNLDNDIDIIITKKVASKSSDFYKEVHDLLDSLKDFINKKDSKMIRFSEFIHQEEVLKIGKYKKGDIALHVLTYISLPQMVDHWRPNMKRKENPSKILKDHYTLIFGDKNFIFSKEFSKEGEYDSFFTYMNDLDRIHSNYPEDFLLKVMNHFYSYLLKKISSTKKLIARDALEVRKYFYELCDILDKLNKKN